MKVTLKDIQEKFDALYSSSQSRESVAAYATQAIEAEELGSLEMEKPFSEKIWKAIIYLSGVDLQDAPNIYLHTANDFIEMRRRLGV